MKLSPNMKRFVLHWGEMGPRWGINRTVAQIHALLYLSEEPLDAEEIAATLSVARSNVSTSIRELLGWGLVRGVQRLGDRREYFTCKTRDVWEMFRLILDERKKRETDPTLAMLRECVAAKSAPGEMAATGERIGAILEFFETLTSFYEQAQRVPTPTLVRAVKAGGAMKKLFPKSG